VFADRSVSGRSHGQMRGGTVRKDDDNGGGSFSFQLWDFGTSCLTSQKIEFPPL